MKESGFKVAASASCRITLNFVRSFLYCRNFVVNFRKPPLLRLIASVTHSCSQLFDSEMNNNIVYQDEEYNTNTWNQAIGVFRYDTLSRSIGCRNSVTQWDYIISKSWPLPPYLYFVGCFFFRNWYFGAFPSSSKVVRISYPMTSFVLKTEGY